MTRVTYDAGGLVTKTDIYASDVENLAVPAPGGIIQTTENYFDLLGQVDSMFGPGERTVAADGFLARKQSWRLRNAFGSPTWSYSGNGTYITRIFDGAGRPRYENFSAVAPNMKADGQRFADPASAAWNASLNLPPRTQSLGQVYTRKFDTRGRLVLAMSQDAALSLTQPFATQRYGFTRTGLPAGDTLEFIGGLKVVRSYQYNRRGQRVAVRSTISPTPGVGAPSSTDSTVYDNATGRVTTRIGYSGTSFPGTEYARVSYTFDRAGRENLRSVAMSGGTTLTTSTRYDAVGRVDSLMTKRPDNTVFYRFGNAVFAKNDELLSYASYENATTLGAHSYTYSSDGTRRLLNSTEGSTSHGYTYDVFGNRLSELFGSTSGGSCTGVVRAVKNWKDNRPLSRAAVPGQPECGPSRYYSDQAGNRLAEADTTIPVTPSGAPPIVQLKSAMSYTAAGQLYYSLTPAVSPGYWDHLWTWYDADGDRAMAYLERTNGAVPPQLPAPGHGAGVWSYYVPDGSDVTLEVGRAQGGDYRVSRRVLSGGLDQPLVGLYAPGPVQALAIVGDRSGTQVVAIQSNGLPLANSDATRGTFGQLLGSGSLGSGPTGAGFTGAQTPASAGYVYLRNRWYDPTSGRFLTQDPIGLAGGVNLYEYAGNNPVNYSDPFGLCPIERTGIPCTFTKGVAGLVAGTVGGATIGATGGTLVVPGVGTVAGAGGLAVVGGTLGLATGATVGAAQDAISLGNVLLSKGLSAWDRLKIKIFITIGNIATKGKLQERDVENARRKTQIEQEQRQEQKPSGEEPPPSEGGSAP